METELWPNLCARARSAGVPLALVNARLSERSLRKGLRWRSLMEPALRSLVCVVAQTPADAQRIERLGRTDVAIAGNMKFDVNPAPALVDRGQRWQALLGGRPVVLAASTRDGEEGLLLDAWQTDARRPLLVIVPRHPQRFDEVAAMLAARGLRFARRGALAAFDEAASTAPGAAQGADAAQGSGGSPAGDLPGSAAAGVFDAASIDVLLGDSMGEMFAWYAMADVAVLGGSLLPFGGQNLIEACALGVPVMMGSHTFNFEDAAAQAAEAGAALRVADASEAVETAVALAVAPAQAALMSAKAIAFARAHRGATGRTLALLAPWLPAPAGGGDS
jgi:3-deoxy-D-manno-octulosonic-acid transferase